MVAVGSTGMAAFDDVAGGAAKLLHYPHAVDLVDGLPSVTRAEAVPIPYEPEEPLARECRHFLHCVATGATPLSDWREGARVLAVLEACQRALASGQPVGLEPAL
jgi:UDP-2-acetamido-3-amino-2,3-dideoxy-glucuronate N-acetyltransferase